MTASSWALAKSNSLTPWNVCGCESTRGPDALGSTAPGPSGGSGCCRQNPSVPCVNGGEAALVAEERSTLAQVMESYHNNTEQLMFKHCQKFQEARCLC